MSQSTGVEVPQHNTRQQKTAVVHRGVGASGRTDQMLEEIAPARLLASIKSQPQKAIPAIAKHEPSCAEIEAACAFVPTTHTLVNGDSRDLSWIADESVHLVVTSPPIGP